MERYEDTIMRELEGDTPKQKYENLIKMKEVYRTYEDYLKYTLLNELPERNEVEK